MSTHKISVKNLRRAETEIDNELNELLHSDLPSDEPTKHKAEESGKDFLEQTFNLLDELTSAKFEIRSLISTFNEATNINMRCNKIAEIELRKANLENLVSSIGNCSESGYGFSSERKTKYRVGLSQEDRTKTRSTIRGYKREIQKLKDTCAWINANGTVDISDKLLDILEKYSII